jgi:hypothetical protein
MAEPRGATPALSATRIAFRERAHVRPILFDGAMGTLL